LQPKNRVWKMFNFPVLEVAAGIILSQNKFLAAKRPSGKPMAGFWEFPGGKIRKGESPFDALCRELEEELGIKPLKGNYLFCREHVYAEEGFIVRLHFFIVPQWIDEPQPREGQEIAWLTPDQAAGMCFLPADQEIVAKIGKFSRMDSKHAFEAWGGENFHWPKP